MDQNLFRHGFPWFAEYDPLAVCWALAGLPNEEDDDDDEEDSYSRGRDDDDEDDIDDDDEEEEEAVTLWARGQGASRSLTCYDSGL